MRAPALGMLEFKSVARGIFATDAVLKKAPIELLQSHPISPGKYMTIFGGTVGDVEEALKAGIQAGGDGLVQDIFIPQLHVSVLPAIAGTAAVEEFGAIAVVETFSACACVYAADQAAKATPINLVELRLAQGLGGKGYFVMTGPLADLEAALEAATNYAKAEGMLAHYELLQSPHPTLIEKAIYW